MSNFNAVPAVPNQDMVYQPPVTGDATLDKINQQYSPPLNSKIGLGSHPAQLDAHGDAFMQAGGPGIRWYGAARSAMASMYSELTAMQNAHDATMIDVKGPLGLSRVPDPARAPELHASMSASLERVVGRLEKHRGDMDRASDDLDKEISRALEDPDKASNKYVARISGLWEYIRAMPNPSDRTTFLNNAVKDGDLTVIAAVLGDSPYLSGLNATQQAVLRKAAEEKFAPKAFRAKDEARKAFEKVERASVAFMSTYNKLLPNIQESSSAVAMRKLRDGK